MTMKIDGLRLIKDHIGELPRVPGLLKMYGVPESAWPTYEQMRKWRIRRHVPHDCLVPLLAILEIERGEPVSLAQYLEVDG